VLFKVSFSALLVSCLAGCTSGVVARSYFSSDNSCPEGAVQFHAIDRPAWQHPRQPPPPAPEVAADPARLKVYQENHPPETFAGTDFYRVEGCRHAAIYACSSGACSDGRGTCTSCSLDTPATGLAFATNSSPPTVVSVDPELSAAKAGILPGDAVVEVEHKPVANSSAFDHILTDASASGQLTYAVKVLRGNQTLDLKLGFQ
jgi:hypothetical protein